MKTKIGVFSGTFDPVHIGHIESCLVAKEACDLDKIYLMIEGSPHRKQKTADFKHRKAMLDLAVADYPSLVVSDNRNENVTTKNTLDFLNHRHTGAEYWYIFGSDILAHITDWPDLDLLLANFNLCVVLRDNKDRKDVEAKLNILTAEHASRYEVLPAVYSEVSSTIAKKDFSNADRYLDKKVIDYIAENKIY